MDHDLEMVSSVPIQSFKPNWMPLGSRPGCAAASFLGQKNRYLCTSTAPGPTAQAGALPGAENKITLFSESSSEPLRAAGEQPPG